MTVVHMDKGRVTIPKETRDARGFGDGSTFAFTETKSGHLVFRPVNPRPKLTLVEHLKKFRGVKLPAAKFHAPPRV
jgi:AbrB family looped-hinge helix DNA binding protein